MRAIADGRFGRAVATLTARHGDAVSFLDLMDDRGRDLRDPNYFGDADHMTGEVADAWRASSARGSCRSCGLKRAPTSGAMPDGGNSALKSSLPMRRRGIGSATSRPTL